MPKYVNFDGQPVSVDVDGDVIFYGRVVEQSTGSFRSADVYVPAETLVRLGLLNRIEDPTAQSIILAAVEVDRSGIGAVGQLALWIANQPELAHRFIAEVGAE